MIRRMYLLLVLIMVGCSHPDSAAFSQPQHDWYEGKLTNGLQYHVYPMKDESVSVRMVFHVGSFQENSNQQGYAHFLEHMAFNGSKHFSSNDVIKMFEKSGASFGADLNAYTSYHETVYQIDLPNKKQLNNALVWMRDIGDGLNLDAFEVEKEKGVVQGEIRRSRPENKNLADKVYLRMISKTPFEQHDVLGSSDSVAAITAERLREFYQTWYQPQYVQIVVAGDVTEAEVKKLVEQKFGDWQPTQRAPRPQKLHHELALNNWVDTIGEMDSPSYSLISDRRSALVTNQEQRIDTWRDDIALQLIGLRLMSAFDDAAQPVQEIAAAPYYIHQRRYNLFTVSFAESDREAAQALLVDTLASLRDHGVSQWELDSVLVDYQHNYDNLDANWNKRDAVDHASDMANSLTSDEPVRSREKIRASLKKLLAKIDVDQINQQIEDILSDEMSTIIGRAPSESQAKLTASIAPMLNRFEQQGAKPLALTVSDSGLSEPSQPGTIISQQEKFGMSVWLLSNGVEVWFERDTTVGDQVFMAYVSLTGKEMLDPELLPAASMLLPVAFKSGVGELNGSALDMHLRRNGISVAPFIGVTDTSFEIMTSKESVAESLKFLYSVSESINVDERHVEMTKQEIHQDRARYFNSPFGRLNKATNQNMYQRDSAFSELSDPDIALVTAAQIKQAHKAIMQTQMNQKLVIVGDLQPAQLTTVLRQYIASIPLEGVESHSPDVKYKSEFKPRIDLAIHNEKSTVYQLRTVNRHVDHRGAKTVFMDDIIQRMLNQQLTAYVREDLGLDYAPEAICNSTDGIDSSEWVIEAQVAPDDSAKIEQAIDKVVRNFASSVTKEQVASTGKQLATDLYPLKDHAKDRVWFYARYLVHDYGVDALMNIDRTVASVSLQDVRTRAELYFGDKAERFKVSLSPKAE
ncbi:M16 family metallopeptidase [Vibrio intestinalis]|uniref:M16 family metallopeptidase n=1 Tax=Vibrio intestinalis TaxID=2933291 RepID=UPI0021A6F8F7|nr:M16 family metallopeptidase [Vibrio intestinalis]